MTPEFLIENFERLAEAPGAADKLRELILELAIRGKLVQQNNGDGSSALELLKLENEAGRLAQEGKFKRLDAATAIIEPPQLFELPPNWVWCSLDQIAVIARGGSPRPIKSYITTASDGIPWIKIGDSDRGNAFIEETAEKIKPEGLKKSRLVVPGDLLLSNSMSFGFPYLSKIKGAIHDGWLVIRTPDGLVDKSFLQTVFLSPFSKSQFAKAASGAVVQNLNADKVRQAKIPLPPLAEQSRIVAKVDELMAKCDELEKRQEAARETRIRVHKASLNSLVEATTPDELSNAWQRLSDNFDSLHDTPESADQIRGAVIDMAVTGRLKTSSGNAESVDTLIDELSYLSHPTSSSKRNSRLKVDFSSEEIAGVQIPSSWRWELLGNLCQFENGDRSKNYPSGADIKPSGIPFISTKNLQNYRVKLTELDFITDDKFKSLRSGKLVDKDLLIVLRGSVGKVGIFKANEDFSTGFINAQLLILRCHKTDMAEYLLLFLRSEIFRRMMLARSTGSAQPQLSATKLTSVPVPVPPLSQQFEIIANVKSLLELCNKVSNTSDELTASAGRFCAASVHALAAA